MRCIIVISIVLGLIVCSTYVQARANGHQDQRHPISEASVRDDDEISSEEFEKFRRASVSVLLDSDSTETTDQLLMRAKLLAYVEKLKAKEAKKKLKAETKAAKQKAFLAAFLPPVTTTTAPAVTTAATNDVTTQESSSSEEESEELVELTTQDPKVARATFNVTVSDSAESSDDLLMRAKLVAFTEKLKAKAAKTKLKAQLKAAKDKAFIDMFLAAHAGVTTESPTGDATPARRAVTAADTPATLLAQAKLDAYVAKLKAKQEKAQLKAQQKAAKQAMFANYLATAANASAAGSPAGTLPGVAPVPILPFPGAVGLWNKSLFLNGLFSAMAQANAAAAAAAAANTPAPPAAVAAPAPAAAEASEEETAPELNEISKRRAPSHHWDQESEEESVEESPEVEEVAPVDEAPPAVPAVARYRPKQGAAYKAARPLSNRDQEILDFWAKYNQGSGVQSAERAEVIPSRRTDIGNRHKPGATNDFKTGPAGSPNGVGYAESPVSQAGCSGSHIHSCSGMTVYINKPEGEDDNETPKVVPVKDQSPKKHHHHKGGDKKKRALKAKRALDKIPAA